MKDFKGTKGKWIVNGLNGIQANSGDIVAIATNDGRLGKDTVKSNARLMAAAPDLLEAALDFVNKVETGNAKSTDSYNKFKVAIEKALTI